MEQIKLEVQGYTINVYHQKGETGEKLMFLHGGGLDNAMFSWREIIRLMEGRYEIYAVDMIGYGLSDKPDITYTVPLYVDLLEEIVRKLGIEKMYLAGLSLGGGVSIGYAARNPQVVEKLILLDPMGLCERMQYHKISRWFVYSKLYTKSYEWMRRSKRMVKWAVAASFIGDKKRVTDEIVTEIFNLCQSSEDFDAWHSLQKYELGPDGLTTNLYAQLNKLSMPVLLVNGERDSVVPLTSAINASRRIKNCSLYVMKGCKHLPQLERPEEFVLAVKAFLQNKIVDCFLVK